MEMPINFKFLDKIAVYQEFLKPDSMLEKTKTRYWLYEKAILCWAYSPDHQHLGVPLGVETFTKNKERKNELESIVSKMADLQVLAEDVIKELGKDEFVKKSMGNLVVLGLASELINDNFKMTESIRINRRGFLLGEMLNERYIENKLSARGFVFYKLSLWFFKIVFLITVILILIQFLSALGIPSLLEKLYLGIGGSTKSCEVNQCIKQFKYPYQRDNKYQVR
ncbi:MAG: hypothetical protein Q8P80_05350 [Candidatus Levybacteria bacterium]|nr:hypothetical protein [Candidatus Levybacteria bacterium]